MPEASRQSLTTAFETQKAAAARDPFPDLDARRANLRQLLALTENYESEFCVAIDADFGGRSAQETRLAEIVVVRAGIRHALRNLSSWIAEKRMPTAMPFWPAKNRLLPQPLGVVGIVSPWNYPFQLALAPATAALAAGNRVLIKPSELTPRFSELLASLVAKHFAADQLSVIIGDAEVGKAFVSMPFDHLLFTGSTSVGRQVAVAAAANLTPVTLELGGKSPAILDPSCDLDKAIASVAFGKLLNAGQTCIAPDYLMVPVGQGGNIARKVAQAMAKLYPSFAGNPDYTAIVSDRHHARLKGMVEEVRARGGEVIEVNPAGESFGNTRKLAPAIVLNADSDTRLMREEIFGPILPIVEYGEVGAAIAYINERDRPLALYWFGKDAAARRRVLRETVAGGVTINDCLMQSPRKTSPSAASVPAAWVPITANGVFGPSARRSPSSSSRRSRRAACCARPMALHPSACCACSS